LLGSCVDNALEAVGELLPCPAHADRDATSPITRPAAITNLLVLIFPPR
jgi:hypothetical protein